MLLLYALFSDGKVQVPM